MKDALQFDLTPPSKDELRVLVADLSEDEKHLLLEPAILEPSGKGLPFPGTPACRFN